SVIAVGRKGLIGTSRFVEYWIHEVARGVPGEWATGAIRSMRPGRQPHDQHTRMRIAETGHGLAPVFAIAIGTAIYPRNFFAIRDQSRTTGTRDDIFVENSKPGHYGD